MNVEYIPREQRVRKNATARESSKPRLKTHLAEWQRTLCGLKISEVPFDRIVTRPAKCTCLGCKRVLARRRKKLS